MSSWTFSGGNSQASLGEGKSMHRFYLSQCDHFVYVLIKKEQSVSGNVQFYCKYLIYEGKFVNGVLKTGVQSLLGPNS